MTNIHIGYARCSTDKQDLSAQLQALLALGVSENHIYTDHGLTGTSRERPGLDQAIAAVREGDTLVVPKLDRLARSVPDARAIADQLQTKGVRLALGQTVYDPADPMGKMFFNILATFAEFEADLIRMRRGGPTLLDSFAAWLSYKFMVCVMPPVFDFVFANAGRSPGSEEQNLYYYRLHLA